MADDLTVKTRGTQGTVPRQSVERETVDEDRADLEKLRALAKAKHGKALNERTLRSIIQRRKAKIQHQEKVTENKEAFESEQAKETLGSKANEIKTQAQKTTGAKQARAAKDGLTSEDRQSIRSDPKAGPKLPPTLAKATTTEQAKDILDRLFGTFELDGEPVDVEAYAKGLRDAPPSKPKDQARQGKQPGQRSSAKPQAKTTQQGPKTPLGQRSSGLSSTHSGSTNRPSQQTTRQPGQQGTRTPVVQGKPPPGGPGTRPGSSTQPGTPQPGAGKPGDPGTTRPLPMPSQTSPPGTALGMRPGSASRLSFRTGGSDTQLASTAVSGDGLFNAGGGLITGSDFDGMSFNWDAFFALFAIRSQKDLQEWRKLMKELRRMEGELELQGYETQIALTKMRQFFERMKTIRQSTTAASKTWEAFHKGQVKAITGHNPEMVSEHKAELRDILKRSGRDVGGRLLLTEGEIDSLPAGLQTEYRNTLAQLRSDGGLLAMWQLAQDSVNAARSDANVSEEVRAELEQQTAMLRDKLDSLARQFSADPVQAYVLNEQRNGLVKSERQTREQIEALVKKQRTDEGLTPDEEQHLRRLEVDRFTTLRSIAMLDWVYGRAENRADGQTEAYLKAAESRVGHLYGDMHSRMSVLEEEAARAKDGPFEPQAERTARLQREIDATKEKLNTEHPEAYREYQETTDNERKLELYEQMAPDLGRLAELERELAANDATPEARQERIKARIDALDKGMQPGPNVPPETPAVRHGYEALTQQRDYLDMLATGTAPLAPGVKEPVQGPDVLEEHPDYPLENFLKQPTEDLNDEQIRSLRDRTTELERIVSAGTAIHEARRDFVHDPTLDGIAEAVEKGFDEWGKLLDTGGFQQAVDNAISGAISMARRHRKEVDGEMRAIAQKSQGMINQLVQLLGVSRSR